MGGGAHWGRGGRGGLAFSPGDLKYGTRAQTKKQTQPTYDAVSGNSNPGHTLGR